MKENRIKVQINKPIEEVFAFTTNPQNTPKWIDSVATEEANESPIKLGTIYRNKGESGGWNEYSVSDLKENELFELSSEETGYHVRYTYGDLGDKTELEYYEWMDQGDLEDPFTQEVLDKLKEVMEQ